MGTGDGLGLKVVALVIGLGLGAGGGVALRDEPSFERNRAPERASAPSPTTTEPLTAAQLTDAVEVESGLSPGNVFACDVRDGGALGWYPSVDTCPPERLSSIGDTVSYGVVLENTSDQVMVSIPVVLRFYDAGGVVVNEPSTVFSDQDLTTIDVTVHALRPGERFGFGGMTYLDRPGATRVDVAVGEPREWMPQAEADFNYSAAALPLPVTADVQSVSSGDDGEPIVQFTVATTGAEAVTLPAAYAILRDEAGRIVGGIDDAFFGLVVRPGRTTEGELVLDDPMKVPGIDPTKVEVYFGPVVI